MSRTFAARCGLLWRCGCSSSRGAGSAARVATTGPMTSLSRARVRAPLLLGALPEPPGRRGGALSRAARVCEVRGASKQEAARLRSSAAPTPPARVHRSARPCLDTSHIMMGFLRLAVVMLTCTPAASTIVSQGPSSTCPVAQITGFKTTAFNSNDCSGPATMEITYPHGQCVATPPEYEAARGRTGLTSDDMYGWVAAPLAPSGSAGCAGPRPTSTCQIGQVCNWRATQQDLDACTAQLQSQAASATALSNCGIDGTRQIQAWQYSCEQGPSQGSQRYEIVCAPPQARRLRLRRPRRQLHRGEVAVAMQHSLEASSAVWLAWP